MAQTFYTQLKSLINSAKKACESDESFVLEKNGSKKIEFRFDCSLYDCFSWSSCYPKTMNFWINKLDALCQAWGWMYEYESSSILTFYKQ